MPSQPLHLCFGPFELDEANARLSCDGAAVALSPRPFELLCALARRPGALMTKHALLDEVWGHRYVSDSVLKGAISEIRTVLGDRSGSPRYIETVPRRGYRFIAMPAAAAQAPPRGMATRVEPGRGDMPASPEETFVGRAAELATLERAWLRASAGRRVVAWIAGEPGIGKTTLIERFIAGLGDVACARGHCVQRFGEGEPYHPVLEALAELGRRDESVASLLRAVAPTWLLQLPWLSSAEQREALLRELVGVNPERMLREMGEFLDRYSERRPLLLVTEDLHWGDRATTQLIDYIARRRSPARLLWLSSFRLAEAMALDHPLAALRHELRLHGLCEEIVLDSFSEREVAAYLARHAPALASDESFVRALHERTEGVPLFVASVADDVDARAASHGAASAALADIPVPRSLSALVEHYVARLDGEDRTLLVAAAVCGGEFRAETLARVLGRDALAVAEACESLVRGLLWLTAPRRGGAGDTGDAHAYAFRHALFRQALLDRAPPTARVELHRKVGEALEAERGSGLAAGAAELAMHFDRGRVPLSALRYYAEAAQTAVQQLNPAECMALSGRALELLDQASPGAERDSIEVTLATLHGIAAFYVLGAGEVARSALERAAARLADAGGHPMRGLLLHAQGFLLNLRGEYDEALLAAARAEGLGAATGDVLLVVASGTVQGQAHMMQGRHEAARLALERALPTLEPAGAASETRFLGFIADPQVTARAMLSLPLVHLGLIGQARAQLQRAYARARLLGQPMARLVAIWFDTLLEVRLGDVDRVGALAGEMQALVEDFELAQGRTACRWFHGWVEARRGRPREGYRAIREALDQNTALGMRAGTTETLGYAAEALLAAGDLDGAQAQLDEALAVAERHGERIWIPQLGLIEGGIARARGRHDAAAAAIRGAIGEARVQDARWLELSALVELCERAAPTADERTALAALVARLDEARDTALLARARVVLAGGGTAHA